ncbi:porin family protein [Marinimicrobium locisalis]|uniref:porin family protein n=1 Tax=Marinimicrobium locisalis TaxID=546022 RepID=UPI003221FBBA
MFKKSAIAAIGLFSLASGVANAEGNYFGGNISSLDYTEDWVDASLTTAYGRLGTHFNENFSGELRVGFGIGEDSADFGGGELDVELDSLYGAYVRGGIPVSENFFPYVVVGYTRVEATLSVSGFGDFSESDTDASYGIGADLNVSQNITLNAEYMNYYDSDGAEISGFAIGIASSF